MPFSKRPFGPGGSHHDLTQLEMLTAAAAAAAQQQHGTGDNGNSSGNSAARAAQQRNSSRLSELDAVTIAPALPDSYLMQLFKSEGQRAMVIPPQQQQQQQQATGGGGGDHLSTSVDVGGLRSPNSLLSSGSASPTGPQCGRTLSNASIYGPFGTPPSMTPLGASSNAIGNNTNNGRPIGLMRNRSSNIRIATYNIFYDLYDDPQIRNYAPERLPLIVSELENLDAEIIALQEVTPWFYDNIRASSALLREQYFWTRLPSPEVEGSYSQVILSRFPILDAAFLNLNARKKCLFALVFMHLSRSATTAPEDCVFLVGNVHLKSDYNSSLGDHKDVRALQLKKIFNAVRSPLPAPSAILNINAGGGESSNGSGGTSSAAISSDTWNDPAFAYTTQQYKGLDLAVNLFHQLNVHLHGPVSMVMGGSAGNQHHNVFSAASPSFEPSALALANLPCVLMGDFNMDEAETLYHMGNVKTGGTWDADFRDIHLSTRSREDERAGKVLHTYDSTNNNLLINTQFPPVRFDRVLIRDFAPVSSGSLRLFGTKPTRAFVPISSNPQINPDAVIGGGAAAAAVSPNTVGSSVTATTATAEEDQESSSGVSQQKLPQSSSSVHTAPPPPRTLSVQGLDAVEVAEDRRLKTMSRKETNAYELDVLLDEAAEEGNGSFNNDSSSRGPARRRGGSNSRSRSGGAQNSSTGGPPEAEDDGALLDGEGDADDTSVVGNDSLALRAIGVTTAPNSASEVIPTSSSTTNNASALLLGLGQQRNSSSRVVPVEDEYAGKWLVDLYPSDHFGVVCNIERSLKTPPSLALPPPVRFGSSGNTSPFSQFTTNKKLTGSFCSIASDFDNSVGGGGGGYSCGTSPAATPTGRMHSSCMGSATSSVGNNTPSLGPQQGGGIEIIGGGSKGGKGGKGPKEKKEKKSKKQLLQEELEAAMNHPSRRHEKDSLSPSVGPCSRQASVEACGGMPPEMSLPSTSAEEGTKHSHQPPHQPNPHGGTLPPFGSDIGFGSNGAPSKKSSGGGRLLASPPHDSPDDDSAAAALLSGNNAVTPGPSSLITPNAHTLPPSPAANQQKSRGGGGAASYSPVTEGTAAAPPRSPSASSSCVLKRTGTEPPPSATSNIGIRMFKSEEAASNNSNDSSPNATSQREGREGGADGPTMPPSAAMSLGSKPIVVPEEELADGPAAAASAAADGRKVVGKTFVSASAAAALAGTPSPLSPTSPTTGTDENGNTDGSNQLQPITNTNSSSNNANNNTNTNNGPTSVSDMANAHQQLSSSSGYRASALALKEEQRQQQERADRKLQKKLAKKNKRRNTSSTAASSVASSSSRSSSAASSSSSLSLSSSSSDEKDIDKIRQQKEEAKRKSAKHHIVQPDGGLSRRKRRGGGNGNAVASLHVDPVHGAVPQSTVSPTEGTSVANDSITKMTDASSVNGGGTGAGANLFKSFATALCIIPPPKLCSHIDIIRTEYDKAYTRWMPHITILYPFVHPAKFPDAIPLLQSAVSKLPPFKVTLRRLAILNEDDPAAKKHVLYIVPEVKTEDLDLLQATVQRVFPQCVRPAMHGQELTADGFPQFKPHLTVGQIPANSAKERNEIFDWFKRHWQNQSFTVSQIHIVMENNDTASAAVGGGNASTTANLGGGGGGYESESRGSASDSNTSDSDSDSADSDAADKRSQSTAGNKKGSPNNSTTTAGKSTKGNGGNTKKTSAANSRRVSMTNSPASLEPSPFPGSATSPSAGGGSGGGVVGHHRNKKGQRRNKNDMSSDDGDDGAIPRTNNSLPTSDNEHGGGGGGRRGGGGGRKSASATPALGPRREQKAQRNAKKYDQRQATQAAKRSLNGGGNGGNDRSRRVGIYEVVHSVALQGISEELGGGAGAGAMTPAMTPKMTPQAPPRMESLMPLPDLVLPPAGSPYSSNGRHQQQAYVSIGGGRNDSELIHNGRADSLSFMNLDGGVTSSANVNDHNFLLGDNINNSNNPQDSSNSEAQNSASSAGPISVGGPTPLNNNATFAALPSVSVIPPSTSSSGTPAVTSDTATPAVAGTTGIAAVLPPSALIAAVNNSSILPTASGLDENSLLPLMVMEESRTSEVYEPTDALERWMARNSDRSLARVAPTHTSQKGGMYHIPSSLLHAFMGEWRTALLASDALLNAKYSGNANNVAAADGNGNSGANVLPPFTPTPFFIEEVRGPQYRLYVDIDMIVCSTNTAAAAGSSSANPSGNSPTAQAQHDPLFLSIATSYLGVASAAAGVMPSSSSNNNTAILANNTSFGGGSVNNIVGGGDANGSSSDNTNTNSNNGITYKNLLRQICIETQQMFGVSEADSAALVLYSHGPWPATPREPTIVAKTGYRMYFQRIFVDEQTHKRYLTRLANEIRRSLGAVPPMCPIGTTWSDIISGDQCAQWDRTRLLGTVKLRRNLQRQYRCIGVFSSGNAGANGWDKELSAAYTSGGDVRRLMFAQMVRVWNCSMWLPKPTSGAAMATATANDGATTKVSSMEDDDDAGGPPLLSLGSPAVSEPPPATAGRREGFYGRQGSSFVYAADNDSDDDDHHHRRGRNSKRGSKKHKKNASNASRKNNNNIAGGSSNADANYANVVAPFVTPLLRPIKPRDPAREIVMDNAFRMDRYFTALEGLERSVE